MSSFFSSIANFINNLFANTFFNIELWGNTAGDYILTIVIFILSLGFVLFIDFILLNWLKRISKRSDTPIDDFIVTLIEKNIFPLFYFGAFYFATRHLELKKIVSKGINVLGIVLLSVFVIRFVSNALKYWLINYVFKKEKDRHKIATIKGLFPTFNAIIWVVGIVFLLDNLGFDISAVVAGLGIGGIAIALAAQSVLGDLFSYFCMLFDHPFVLGDFIIVGDFMGTVEKIGIKTTRIRSLSGEQIVIPNTDLTGARVRNYKRMKTRRIPFTIGVTYETPSEKLKMIPKLVEDIIKSVEKVEFSRCHFYQYGDFSLNFEIVYIVQSGDYDLYMDIQQEINFKMFDEFAKQGIEFAYPTQTVHIPK